MRCPVPAIFLAKISYYYWNFDAFWLGPSSMYEKYCYRVLGWYLWALATVSAPAIALQSACSFCGCQRGLYFEMYWMI